LLPIGAKSSFGKVGRQGFGFYIHGYKSKKATKQQSLAHPELRLAFLLRQLLLRPARAAEQHGELLAGNPARSCLIEVSAGVLGRSGGGKLDRELPISLLATTGAD
jgi:hypothetical protein